LDWVLYILTVGVAAMWVGRLFVLSLFDKFLPPLSPSEPNESSGDLPSMSMIVAAKDEAANIETCVRSLTKQEYPGLEVICVDDRSDDATPQILDRLARELDGFRYLRIKELPDGWFGKNHAMHHAVADATGEWLCFTDADCEFLSPHVLTTALEKARDLDADFLSILPSHKAESFWERVIQPACSAVMMLWFNPMSVNRGKVAYANGAFMLMKRSCYDAFGGHAAVRTELNEDIAFARRARDAGQNLQVQVGRGLYTVRMYSDVRQMWRGWTRIFVGSFPNAFRILLALFVIGYFSVFPWLVAAGALLAGQTLVWQAPSLLAIALVSLVFQIAAMSVFYRLSAVPMRFGLVYPLGGLVACGTLINALYCALGGGRVKWRGTTYRDGAVESKSAPVLTGAAKSVEPPLTVASADASNR